MILSFVSQKGGVGKSTLARLVGVEMARAGWNVLIADLDSSQGTSTTWHQRRVNNEITPDLDVMRYRSVDLAAKQESRYDLVIMDGPAHAERGGLTMAKLSELVILPTGYSLDDLDPQCRVAYELEDAGIPADKIRISICRARGSASEAQTVRDYIRRGRLTAFEKELRELPTIRQAHTLGRAASETTHAHINAEAVAVAQEIAEDLIRRAGE